MGKLMNPIRIFIVSENTLFIRGLQSLLAHEACFEIIGEAPNARRAIEQLETLNPHVIILGNGKENEGKLPVEMQFLTIKSSIRLISLNLLTNDLFVYHSKFKHVKSVEDLVEAITWDSLGQYP